VAAGLAAALAALFASASAPAAVDGAGSAQTSHQCLVMTGSGDPAFVKNFNPYTGNTLPSGDFVRGAFYEPLVITTAAGGGRQYPWLAQSWKWSHGNRTLTLNIRHGVKWSDGKPLTSADVVYSLTAGKQDSSMDLIGYTHPDSNITSITAKGPYKVVISLKQPDSTFIAATLNAQYIVPKHIWSKVAKPSTWTNPNPVGSGPFDVIKTFTAQDYVLGKNPHYWLKGAPKVPCLEYVQAASNDAALALIQSGQVDWTHNFVPNAATAYSSKDPAHFHYFYATTSFAQSLVFDDTQYPYSIPAFRKALSLAIDRNSVSKLGEYGYGPPTDALGLSGVFPTWYTPALKEAAKAAATYNPAKAKQLLTQAGFTYKGNTLLDPKGNPVSLDIHVISGWSDWVATDQIIAKDLQAIGINSSEVLEPDWNSWYPNASTTKNPTLLWQNVASGTPWGYFNANLSQNAYTAPGQDATATSNWAHFYDNAVQPILNNWRNTLSVKQQHADFVKAATLFLQDQPIVPIYIGPEWSTFSTKYFHGFPTPSNYYAQPIFTQNPDNILAFTRIAPGGKNGE
jgi:peptide/nickel transport system substrate-binding protein